MTVVAVTGATGFIGRHLVRELPQRGVRVRALLRRPAALPDDVTAIVVGDLARPHDLTMALDGVDAVIHCAGIAHLTGFAEDEYHAINTVATADLARAARRAGVARFVFLSSIRAQCGPSCSEVVTEAMAPRPTDAYGRSKLAAERQLAELDLDWVALRPVLVYGPGAPANMAQLMKIAKSRLPLPFGSIAARRSLLALRSLAAAIETTLSAPPARLRRAYVVADDEPLTVGEMIAAMREGLGRRPSVFSFPPAALRVLFQSLGRREAFGRLAGALVVDASALGALGWAPIRDTHAELGLALKQCASDA